MRQEKSDPSLYRKTPKSFARNLMNYTTFITENDMDAYEPIRTERAPKNAAYYPRYK
jgi:hypothetical protein